MSTTDEVDIIGTVSRHDPISVYDLANKYLKWSYGKTERKVADLIKAGKLHYRTKVEKGRNIKLLSLQPIEEGIDSAPQMPEIVKQAYVDLYGVFLALGRKASNEALSRYADKVQKQPNELSTLFSDVLKMCSQKQGAGANG